MIGYLKGKVKFANGSALVIDVHDVGYRVLSPVTALENEEIELFIYTHVREQEITLFGFKKQIDLNIFELLLSVSGVGPKSALQIVGEVGGDGILNAISSNNPLTLKVKGIGAKTAEKIILELKGKIDRFKFQKSEEKTGGFDESIYIEVSEALVSLGYRKNEIDAVINTIEWTATDDTQTVIKRVLQILKK